MKNNRLVEDSGGEAGYKQVSELDWTEKEKKKGKRIKINKFPKDCKHQLFCVIVSSNKTEWLVTNELSQSDVEQAQKESAIRWKIEQLHRELKQLTGIEKCQCRKNRSQRNHICCSILVWHSLKAKAIQWKTSLYQVKESMLKNYMIEQMKQPYVNFD